ncbi:MAG: xanthine dehydrogenase family protein subunit M [PVC group bacterium]
MISFNLVRAGSLEAALDFLAENGEDSKIIAGGTDLLVELRGLAPGEKGPANVLDISAIAEIKGIEDDGTTITVGAGTTHREIHTSPVIREQAPLLAAACSTVGAAQHRNIATIGGNIMNASPAADSVPALVALDAEAVFRSKKGERVVPLKDIYVKPYQTNAGDDEMLTAVRFRRLPPGARSAFIKLGRRNALAISRMNVAVILVLNGDAIVEARISPGSTTPMPERITAAEKLLIGKKPSEELFRQAGEAVSGEMIARSGIRWSTPYKKPVIEALTARALKEAWKSREQQGAAGMSREQRG